MILICLRVIENAIPADRRCYVVNLRMEKKISHINVENNTYTMHILCVQQIELMYKTISIMFMLSL